MKRGSDQVRKPAQTRGYRVESGSRKNISVGAALRKAKKDLFVRRFIGFLLVVLLIAAIIAIAYAGYFGKLIQYLMDRIL